MDNKNNPPCPECGRDMERHEKQGKFMAGYTCCVYVSDLSMYVRGYTEYINDATEEVVH